MSLLDRRASGILLHPTSLPGPHGSGDFGPSARHFVDWLAVAGQSLWQVLPLNPIGPGNSPYASVSSFAGSPLLIALEPLIEQGWLAPVDPARGSGADERHIDFGRCSALRMDCLRRAAAGFEERADGAARQRLAAWCARQAYWLDDYALFMALDAAFRAPAQDLDWTRWNPALARRQPAAMALARQQHAREIGFWQFVQWCFDEQWQEVRHYARGKGVGLLGDLPIFVAHHSADCWARPDLFLLDAQGAPKVVAGVPPDFFSATGQRWGNPLYDWPAMKNDGYGWWIDRVRRQLELADALRIDHFRGFASHWEIPADCPTAIGGAWQPGPGAGLFTALKAALGELPLIAEDLGVITADVVALREQFALPGMRILQFGFAGDAAHEFLPHNYPTSCCAYTGTHDNDTVIGWWRSASAHERRLAAAYLDFDPTGAGGNVQQAGLHWRMIHALSASAARLVIYPMQDVLGMGPEHRMNTPSSLGCWTWRFQWGDVGALPAPHLARMASAHGRAPIEMLDLPGYPAHQTAP